MSKHTIPELKRGQKFRVVLRSADFSLAKGVLLPSGATVPDLVLPDQCICCNSETKNRVTVNPFNAKKAVSNLPEVPVCTDCTDHAFVPAVPIRKMFMLLFLLIALLCAYCLLTKTIAETFAYKFWMFFSLFISFICGISLLIRNRRLRSVPAGHHSAAIFDSKITRELVITTGNRRFVEDILLHNENTVYLVNTTADPEPFF